MRVVLAITEESALKESLRTVLAGEHLLLEASSTAEAAKTLLTRPVDLVLLDALPSRPKLLEGLNRLWEVRPRMPVVLLSVLSDSNWIDEIVDYGVSEVLPKPFAKSQLLAAVRRTAGGGGASDRREVEPERSRRAETGPAFGAAGGLASLLSRMTPLLNGLTSLRDLPTAARRLLDGMTSLFGASGGILLLDDEDEFSYRPAASSGILTLDKYPLALGPKSDLVREAMENRRILLRSECLRAGMGPESGLVREMDLLGVETVLPLWGKGRLMGLLGLGNRLTGNPYTPEDLESLGMLSFALQSALENAIEFQETASRGRDYQVIVQDLGSGVITTDRYGLVTAINPRAEEILGVHAATYTGKPVQKLSSRIADMLLRTLEKKETFSRHEFRYGKEGMLLGASSSRLRSSEGETVGAVLTFTDITEEKRRETRKIDDLKFKEILNLSAWLAHQVKNPLVGIKTFTEMLPSKFSDKEFREKFVEIVGTEAARLDNVISKLVQFGAEMPLRKRATPVRKLTKQLLADLEGTLKERGVKIEEADVPEDLTLEGDPALLREAFRRLFLNVVRSVEEKAPLRLSAEARCAEGPDRNANGWEGSALNVEIRLFEPGLEAGPASRVDSLFDLYEDGRPDYDLLGTAIAHRVIRAHDGWIEEGRFAGKETDLRIHLPCVAKGEKRRPVNAATEETKNRRI